MADDQTVITPDQPIPEGYSPYKTSSVDPSGNRRTTMGYAPRTPIAPPGGSVPDLTQGYSQAFQNLPVDEAAKAVEVAMRYQGQRGYLRDLAGGMNAAQAFAKWAPLMFKQATGVPEALDVQLQQAKMKAPSIHPGSAAGLYRIPPTGPAEQLVAPQPKAPVRPPASVELVNAIQEAEKQATEAEQSGDKAKAESLKERANLLREQAKGQQGISMEFGPGGTLQSFSSGGTNPKPTIAMATQAQEKLVKYKNSLDLMNRLEDVLKPEHVGVRGAAGEVLVDKGLQQAAETFGLPDVANTDRIQARKLMVALREGLMREMNDGSRFSLADREEISKALPSSGIFESGKDAKEALAVVRKVLTQRSQNYARSIGKSTPLWTLSKEQIKTTFPKPEDLIKAAKSGKVDKQEAEDALTEYY